MPASFHQTLRALDGDRGRARIAAGAAALLGLAWLGWMALAEVPLLETSTRARLEVSPAPSRVAAVVGARVVTARLAVGARVAAGDLLVELDADAERLALSRAREALAALDPELASLRREIAAETTAASAGGTAGRSALREQLARVAAGDLLVELDADAERLARSRAREALAALDPELASLRREIAAETTAASAGGTAGRSALREQLARVRAADAELEHAQEELARAGKLAEAGAIAQGELARARVELASKQAARDALGHQSDALIAAERARDAGRTARLAELERQRAEVERAVTAARAEVARLELEVERRQIRAPLAGVLGEVAALRPGAVLAAGDVVATIVPDGALRLVAEYGPAAIGRLLPGQPARLRLDGFPWTRWGVARARVTAVASELRDGAIRVELALEPRSHLPLAHGMTGRVDVEVEQASPIALVLRSLVERPADAR